MPGHKELLAVLWEMGILPGVQVLPANLSLARPPHPNRENAIDFWTGWLRPLDVDLVRGRLTSGFDHLFAQTDRGFVPTWSPHSREMLITWETTRA